MTTPKDYDDVFEDVTTVWGPDGKIIPPLVEKWDPEKGDFEINWPDEDRKRNKAISDWYLSEVAARQRNLERAQRDRYNRFLSAFLLGVAAAVAICWMIP